MQRDVWWIISLIPTPRRGQYGRLCPKECKLVLPQRRISPPHEIETFTANFSSRHIQSYLNDVLDKIAEKRGVSNIAKLTSRLHVWPDFHGNRSPVADPALLGMVWKKLSSTSPCEILKHDDATHSTRVSCLLPTTHTLVELVS